MVVSILFRDRRNWTEPTQLAGILAPLRCRARPSVLERKVEAMDVGVMRASVFLKTKPNRYATRSTQQHRQVLTRIIYTYRLHELHADVKELAFALYNAAIGEKERDLIPRVGLATDRRALGYVGEVFHEENASVLMCFICSCKKLCHEGVDKFGNPMHKG